MTRLSPTLILASGLVLLASPAWAGDTAVCHPTGKGYVLIQPAQASSHIDESAYPNGHYWKHEHSGRHDLYAVNGTCPGAPTPTTTGGTPSATTTTTSPSPSTTSSTPTSTRTSSPTSTAKSSTPQPTRSSTPSYPYANPSTGTATPTPSHPTSAPSSTGELARTGTELTNWAVLGVFLLAVGGLVLAFRRILGGGR